MAPPISLITLLWLFTLDLVPAQQWVLQNVEILDVQQGELKPGTHDIYIAQGRILQVISSDGKTDYTGFNQIDGSGKYLIPGLWDMHVHPDDPEVWRMNPLPEHRDLLLPQFVLQGVTGIRDMAGDMAVINRWREMGEAGDLLVPRIIAAGPLLDGPDPMWDGSVGIGSPGRVPAVIDSLMLSGSDFIKIYSLLPRDIYMAVAEYAKRIQVPFVGHVPYSVLPSEAARTGMKSQEHLLEILKECSSISEYLRSGRIDYGDLTTGLDKYVFRQELILESFDPDKFQQLVRIFADTETWITPTLSMWYKNAWYESEWKQDSTFLKFIPPYLRDYWTPGHNDHLRHRNHPDFIQAKQRLYQRYKQLVQAFYAADIKLLAGTDMGANPLCFPGIGLHNELEALVQAGLSPAAALQTATLNPVNFLGLEQDYGAIADGMVADLVILEANPLTDINHIREIWGVVKNGVLYDPQARSQQLQKIAQQLAQP